MINKVTLIGNLGKDPEIRKLDNGAMVARFSLATNEVYRDKAGEFITQTEWHDVVAWRLLAEKAERDLKKGSLVYIEGKLSHRKYTDANNIDRYVTEVVAYTLKGLDRRTGGSDNFPNSNDEPPMSSNYAKKTDDSGPEEPSQNGGGADDDLPF